MVSPIFARQQAYDRANAGRDMTDEGRSALAGIRAGVEGTVGLPGDVEEGGDWLSSWMFPKGLNPTSPVTGKPIEQPKGLPLFSLPTSEDVAGATAPVLGETYEPKTWTGTALEGLGEMAPDMLGAGALLKKGFHAGRDMLSRKMAGGAEDIAKPVEQGFEDWFARSQARTPEGDPLQTYHMTTNTFDTFDKSKGPLGDPANGFFFSADPNYRHISHGSRPDDVLREGANVHPTYLDIRNPYFAPRSENMEGLNVWQDAPQHIEDLKAKGHDAVVWGDPSDWRRPPQGAWGDDRSQIFVFEPEQIRSAIDANAERLRRK